MKGEQIWTEMRDIFLYGLGHSVTKELLHLPVLTKKTNKQKNKLWLQTLQSHDIKIVPDYSALHLHNVCALLCFSLCLSKQSDSPVIGTKRKELLGFSPFIFPINQICGITPLRRDEWVSVSAARCDKATSVL